jgi:hypothetical protein
VGITQSNSSRRLLLHRRWAIALCLWAVVHLLAYSVALASDTWQEPQVAAYWQEIQKQAPLVPDATFHRTDYEGAWLTTATLQVHLYDGWPLDDDMKRILWHEAGHAVHVAHPELVHDYLELRQLSGVFRILWYEVFAEDFVVCAGRGPAWSFYRFMGKPSDDVCQLMKVGG